LIFFLNVEPVSKVK